MTKTLVIVESPGKISKISNILGSNYVVKASYGHVQDLDKETLSIEIENNFNPLYKITPEKVKVVKELKTVAKECNDIIIASDGDREGEAIAYSLSNVLNLKNPKRIIFNEITKNAILKAIEKPTIINNNLVNAQQARRLLDRLVGYLISPVLWKHLSSNSKSAGRVQSVVLRIIIDKEEEIKKAISTPYYLTTIEYNDFNGTLSNNPFNNKEEILEFYNKINKKTIYIILSIKNSISIRNPSPPFITSSLQQEASTKLHFNIKKTMDVAQKLYEAGHITYMRTDSPNMSKEALKEAKEYIVNTWGIEYHCLRNYESKESSQDAHECIRPTHLNIENIEMENDDQNKLYNLIWKRTIASQMSSAKINVQKILSDVQNLNKSILNGNHFISILENIEFSGYKIVYDNLENSDEIKEGKILLNEGDKLKMKKIKISMEYTKPPLRYNEALLIKYLEKNGIGRPSTYASIISKVIERNYIEIKNIDGEKKESLQMELSSSLKIKEEMKEIFIGKEHKKIIPTSAGIEVNDFMIKNFNCIVDIEYTANLETYLDKIADGKANWITVLRNFYEQFNPMVEKLSNIKVDKKTIDKLLGIHENNSIYCGNGKYGPYIKIINNNNKTSYVSFKNKPLEEITFEDAIKCIEYPKQLGKIGNAIVTINQGPYGLYVKCGNKNFSIKEDQVIDIEYVKQLMSSGDVNAIKSYKVKNKIINIKKGESNYYIQIVSGITRQNIPIPNSINIENITIDEVLNIIGKKNGINNIKKKELII